MPARTARRRHTAAAGKLVPGVAGKTQRFRANRPLQLMAGWIAALWVAGAIAPFDRFDWMLENLLFFATLGVFAATYRRFAFSNASYALLALFMTLHLVGAHYTYSETPIGFWLQDAYSLARNHYDRLVHFSFGLLWFYPGREALMRLIPVSRAWAAGIALALISGIGAFYEVIEAGVALAVSPALGAAYLGTQGDSWDAQWDMLAQVLGGVVAAAVTGLAERGRRGI